jgi:Na+:H+ antiporter, NhaC family
MGSSTKEMTTLGSVIIFAIITALISVSMLYFHLPTRVTLLLTIVTASVVCLRYGHTLADIQHYIITGIKKSAFVVAILLCVGCVIGTWITGGIVPTIIYYGLTTLTPTIFLVGGLISCCLVSYFTGSSFSCMGTMGIALMGIGQGLGIPQPLTAGMVLSGAVFGDKMSPFSDTTNLAAAASNTPLFTHIHSMIYTTAPALVISGGLYWYLGASYTKQALDYDRIHALMQVIDTHFTVSPILLLVPLFTIIMAVRKVPPIVALFTGAILGVIVAFIFQYKFGSLVIFSSLTQGLTLDFGDEAANTLFSNRGGMGSMLYPASVAMLALVLGEMLNRSGVLNALIRAFETYIWNTGMLVTYTIATCLATTMLSASQYLSIIMPGEALQPLYRRRGVSSRILSRSLEDGGTMFSTLIPWAGDAAFVAGTLGVATTAYYKFAFFNLLCPVISIIYGFVGIAIWSLKDDELAHEEPSDATEEGIQIL